MIQPKIHKRKIHGIDVLEVLGDPGAPAILLFHGYGADGRDLLPLSQALAGFDIKPSFYFPTGPLEVPIAPGYSGRGWFPIDIEALKDAIHGKKSENVSKAFPKEYSQIRQIAQLLIAELNIPLSKLILGGFSQGAILAIDTALHASEKIGGLLIFSGIMVNEEEWKKRASQYRGIPFFQSHGHEDQLLPFDRAVALEKFLKDSGLKGKLHSFHGGHEIPHAIIVKLNAFLKEHIS